MLSWKAEQRNTKKLIAWSYDRDAELNNLKSALPDFQLCESDYFTL